MNKANTMSWIMGVPQMKKPVMEIKVVSEVTTVRDNVCEVL